jgi:chromosome segregation ATPase
VSKCKCEHDLGPRNHYPLCDENPVNIIKALQQQLAEVEREAEDSAHDAFVLQKKFNELEIELEQSRQRVEELKGIANEYLNQINHAHLNAAIVLPELESSNHAEYMNLKVKIDHMKISKRRIKQALADSGDERN